MTARIADPRLLKYLQEWFAPDKLANLLSALSRPPLRTTVRVVGTRSPASVLQELSALVPPEFSPTMHPLLSHCLVVPMFDRSASVRPSAPAVVVDRACGLAVLRGADVFAAGVLGMAANLTRGERVSVWADLLNRTRRGTTLRGAAALSDSGTDFKFVGNGVLEQSKAAIAGAAAQGLAVRMDEPIFHSAALNGVLSESLFLQNEESFVAALALDPQPGERVLDMCAAPGGKTCHIGDLMQHNGTLIAVDRSAPKIAKLMATADRFRCNVRVVLADACRLEVGSEHVCARTGERVTMDLFDRILVDAPCSGLGQRPRAVIEQSLAELLPFAAQQRRILQRACRLLKPGGRLVFSTCTFMPSENEQNVEFILRDQPSMRLIAALPKLGGDGIRSSELSFDSTLVQRFDPGAGRDGIGFFVACFEKVKG
jgi:16S rRNA C967 or C1407 C5-methylase (RsmB/RsmF family)